MRLENMKQEIPETPDFIHRMILDEVRKQVGEDKRTTNFSDRKKHKRGWSAGRVAAAIIACVVAVTTATYAGTCLYHMYLEKKGTYRVLTGISADQDADEIILPERIHDVSIEAGYIPEGMRWRDDTHLEYVEKPGYGGFFFQSVLLDQGDLKQTLTDTGVVDSETLNFGEREGVYIRYQDMRQNGSYSQRVYMLFREQYRILIIYIGDEVSKEEAVKVAENITLTETDTMIGTKGRPTWSNYVSPVGIPSDDEAKARVSEDNLKFREIGEEFYIGGAGKDTFGNYLPLKLSDVSVTVDSVRIADDLSLLDKERIPEKWDAAVGSDGKLVKNNLSYIKFGDGAETLDEVAKTEAVNQKLVYVTVTYANHSDAEIHDMLYRGGLMLLNHEKGQYQIYDYNLGYGLSDTEYDQVLGDSVAETGEMTYFTPAVDYENGGNYISSLKPGESVQAAMAWIVNEEDLDHMYLDLTITGTTFIFTDDTLKNGIVNICR